MGLAKGGLISKHRTILFCKVGKERGNIAFAKMWIEQHLTEGDSRNLLGQKPNVEAMGPARLWETAAAMDRPINSILQMNSNAGLCLLIKLKHEAKDVAGVDEADNDDISRVWNLVVEDRIADSGFDELNRSAFWGVADQPRLPGSTRQRPEFAVVVFQDLEGNQAARVKSMIDSARGASRSIQYCLFLRTGSAAITFRMGSRTELPVSVWSTRNSDS